MRSWRDYILGKDLRLFCNVSIRDTRHKSDHYLVLGCLRSAPLREHSEYLGRRKQLPLQPLTTPTREDVLFVALQRAVLKPKSQYARKKMWILETTWIIFKERVSAIQDPARDQSLILRLVCAIAEIFKGFWRRWAEEAGEEVEKVFGLYPPLREAWHHMKGWYWAAVYHSLPPAWVTLERITAERVDLYMYVPPVGDNIPVSVDPFPVEDSVPAEDEIEWSVTELKNHCSGEYRRSPLRSVLSSTLNNGHSRWCWSVSPRYVLSAP